MIDYQIDLSVDTNATNQRCPQPPNAFYSGITTSASTRRADSLPISAVESGLIDSNLEPLSNTEEYNLIDENPWKIVKNNPLSTFMTTEISDSPGNNQHQLVNISIQDKNTVSINSPPSNLVPN